MALERIVVNGDRLVGQQSLKEFVFWGAGFNHNASGAILEDFWLDNQSWPWVLTQLDSMVQNRLNGVRLLLQAWPWFSPPSGASGLLLLQPGNYGGISLPHLRQLETFLIECRNRGLYVILTGLGIEDDAAQPSWYTNISEAQRWSLQKAYWTEIARMASNYTNVLAYDLMNEPTTPWGANTTAPSWSAGAIGGYTYVQNITLDLAGRTSAQVVQSWLNTIIAGIRTVDTVTNITVGCLPIIDSGFGFAPANISSQLDFLCSHIYPTSTLANDLTKANAYSAQGKPVLNEEIFCLNTDDANTRAYIDSTRKQHSAGMSWQWSEGGLGGVLGTTITPQNAITLALGRWSFEIMNQYADALLTDNPPGNIAIPMSDLKMAGYLAPAGSQYTTLAKRWAKQFSLEQRIPSTDTWASVQGSWAVLETDISDLPLRPGNVCNGATLYAYCDTAYESVLATPGTTSQNQWDIIGGQPTASATLDYGSVRQHQTPNTSIYLSPSTTANGQITIAAAPFSLGSRLVSKVRLWYYMANGMDSTTTVAVKTGATTRATTTIGYNQPAQWRYLDWIPTESDSGTVNSLGFSWANTSGVPSGTATTRLYRAYYEISLVPDSTVVGQLSIRGTPATLNLTAGLPPAWRKVSYSGTLTQSSMDGLIIHAQTLTPLYPTPPGFRIYTAFIRYDIARSQTIATTGISDSGCGQSSIGTPNKQVISISTIPSPI